jgi:hypothetical protein
MEKSNVSVVGTRDMRGREEILAVGWKAGTWHWINEFGDSNLEKQRRELFEIPKCENVKHSALGHNPWSRGGEELV